MNDTENGPQEKGIDRRRGGSPEFYSGEFPLVGIGGGV